MENHVSKLLSTSLGTPWSACEAIWTAVFLQENTRKLLFWTENVYLSSVRNDKVVAPFMNAKTESEFKRRGDWAKTPSKFWSLTHKRCSISACRRWNFCASSKILLILLKHQQPPLFSLHISIFHKHWYDSMCGRQYVISGLHQFLEHVIGGVNGLSVLLFLLHFQLFRTFFFVAVAGTYWDVINKNATSSDISTWDVFF